MNKDSKIYIAGHKGLVGSALVRVLQREGYTNLIFKTREELDLTEQSEVNAFFKMERPEYVFLAAAKVGAFMQIILILQNLFFQIFKFKTTLSMLAINTV